MSKLAHFLESQYAIVLQPFFLQDLQNKSGVSGHVQIGYKEKESVLESLKMMKLKDICNGDRI